MAEATLERLFAALSAGRGRRIFHPQGIAFRAHLRVSRGVPGVPLLGAGAQHEAVVRFSRALGLPRGRRDFLGLALRVMEEQDLLLASSAAAPLGRVAPVPAASFFDTTFSSLLPLRAGARVVFAGARLAPEPGTGDDQLQEVADAAGRAPIRISLALAEPLHRWRTIGWVELGARLPEDAAAQLTFDPWRCSGGLVPAGRVNALRAPAYRGSRLGRGVGGATA